MTAAVAELVLIGRSPGRTVTLRPAPPREPPFDDEIDALTVVGRHDRPLPFEPRHTAPLSSVNRTMSPLRAALPDPSGWARRLLIGIIETAAGKRPLHQLAALLGPGVVSGLGADFERAARGGRPHWTSAATVRSVRSSEPVDGVAELSATLGTGSRVRAIAMRLEVRHGRWCCTRLLLG